MYCTSSEKRKLKDDKATSRLTRGAGLSSVLARRVVAWAVGVCCGGGGGEIPEAACEVEDVCDADLDDSLFIGLRPGDPGSGVNCKSDMLASTARTGDVISP